MLGVARDARQLVAGDALEQLGLAAAQHARDAALRAHVEREAPAQLDHQLALDRIDVGDLDRHARALVARELDDAQVGDARHREPRDAGQGVLVFERGRERAARLEQERGAALRGLALDPRVALGFVQARAIERLPRNG